MAQRRHRRAPSFAERLPPDKMPLPPLPPHVSIRVEYHSYFLRPIIVITDKAMDWYSFWFNHYTLIFWYLDHAPIAVASRHGGTRAEGQEDHKSLTCFSGRSSEFCDASLNEVVRERYSISRLTSWEAYATESSMGHPSKTGVASSAMCISEPV